MLRKALFAILPLVLIILVPILLKTAGMEGNPGADQLVIVSPHNESIRYEFERAFRQHYREKFGRDVDIDWRIPGGTSEIVRYLRSEYTAAFKNFWEQRHGQRCPAAIQSAFLNSRLHPEEAPAEHRDARQSFLESEIGIGIDLFFGGGQYDLHGLARDGILVPCGVRERHPELFSGPDPIIPQSVGGEVWYDPEDRYYGTCLSAFGICYNVDRLQELGFDGRDRPFPSQWQDLADPRLRGQIGLADPSKSGSINKCFEMLIQQHMAATVARLGRSPTAVAQGWEDAMLLIRMIGANARYFTFSASKVPVDVGQGAVAAGMCIDFYGRSQAEWEQRGINRNIMAYVTPKGGSSVSADPIGLLRGAPHERTALEFIDFVLSRPGQQLWNYRPETTGGPHTYALRRLPIRRDLYTDADRECMSDPQAQPFTLAQSFVYHAEWTGRLFSLIRILVRVMIIDCHQELRAAWANIQQAGGMEAVPEAAARLRRLPFDYEQAEAMSKALRTPGDRVLLSRQWGAFFRSNYVEAARLAQGGSTVRAADADSQGR